MDVPAKDVPHTSGALVVAIAGPTAAGKSTLVASLKKRYAAHIPVFHLCQDDFYIVHALKSHDLSPLPRKSLTASFRPKCAG